MYDVIIIGAGPAGTTLARLISTKYRVLVLEKRHYSAARSQHLSKCCGGLLAPDAQKTLSHLGLGIPREVLVGPQLFTVRAVDMTNNLERYYQRHYINIDRWHFDTWLASLLPPAVSIRYGCTVTGLNHDGRIIVQFRKNRKEYRVCTRFLIGADGAHSLVRKKFFPDEPAPQQYIAIQEWYAADNALPYFSAVFDSEVTDFYSWTIPKEEYLIIGSALLPRSNPLQKFCLLKERLRSYGLTFGRLVKKSGGFLLRPVRLNQICLGTERIALIGEAAGWISPSSAEGLSFSFRSALALAQSMLQSTEHPFKRYRQNTRELKQAVLCKNLKSPFMYHPLLRKLVMKSGLRSMEIH
jgi:geranylgeranyl reductase